MVYGLVKNNTLVSVEILDANQAAAMASQYDAVIDITNLHPSPQVGWTLADGVLNGPAPVQTWLITKLAMLQRFSLNERLAILTYIQSNPVSIPAVLLQNIQVATYIDLHRADTQAGIGALVGYGLITSDRGTAILTTPPSDFETYKG